MNYSQLEVKPPRPKERGFHAVDKMKKKFMLLTNYYFYLKSDQSLAFYNFNIQLIATAISCAIFFPNSLSGSCHCKECGVPEPFVEKKTHTGTA